MTDNVVNRLGYKYSERNDDLETKTKKTDQDSIKIKPPLLKDFSASLLNNLYLCFY